VVAARDRQRIDKPAAAKRFIVMTSQVLDVE
jgi:hypothetical protein